MAQSDYLYGMNLNFPSKVGTQFPYEDIIVVLSNLLQICLLLNFFLLHLPRFNPLTPWKPLKLF